MSSACVRCGTFLASVSETVFSDDGDPMCVPCRERIDGDRREKRTLRTLVITSTLGLLGALVGLPVAALFVLGGLAFSAPALGTGLRLLALLQLSPTEQLGGLRSHLAAASWVTTVLGGLGTLLMVGKVGLVLFRLATMP